MGTEEFENVKEAFDTNWIAPVGPHVDAFEKELSLRRKDSLPRCFFIGAEALVNTILTVVKSFSILYFICRDYLFDPRRLMMNYKVIIMYDKEYSGYIVDVPELNGCMSQGNTIDKALANVKDAIEGWLHVEKKHKRLVINEIKEMFVGEVAL